MSYSHVSGGRHRSMNEGDGRPFSMNRTARIAGLFYLIFISTFALADLLRSQFIVTGDAAATAQNISSNELLVRLSFLTELASALFFVLAAWALYVLLKSVNKDLALLFLFLNLGGVVVECINMLNLLAALMLLNGASYLTVLPIDQLQAQVQFYLDMYTNGIMIAQVFFATWLIPLGYLVYRSGFLPRFLGILLILDFVGVLVWLLQFFLLPDMGMLSYPGWVVSFVAEVSLTLWLLIMGVKNQEAPLRGDG
jgi:hypothetical protein